MSLRALERRPIVSIVDQYEQWPYRDCISLAEFERIWLSLARHYGLPPTRLLLIDKLDNQLAQWYRDENLLLIYYQPRFGAFLAEQRYENPRTWSDLIRFVHNCEREHLRDKPANSK